MISTGVVPLLLFFSGTALLLDHAPWFSRRSLVRRLEPYARRSRRRSGGTIEGLWELVGPGVERFGDRVSALVGADETLADRLEFIPSLS